MQKRQVFINAIMSVIQTVVISVILFILYRFLLTTIGVEQLGIWSLVLAITSITNIASFGLTGSVVKFVAKYIAREEEEKVSEVIQTAIISIGVFVGMILLGGYPIIKWVLSLVIPNSSFPLVLSILPYAFFALWLMAITSIFQSGLDGCQRIDIRTLLLMGGAILNLLLCFLLVPKYGLLGVAYARVIDNFLILICSWTLLKKYIPYLPVFPLKWNRTLFREVISYGLNFQVISTTRMFYDPITKALLCKFGNLSMVGYYEMANRMILQLRSLIVSANQVLVPAIADLKEKIPEKIHVVYLTSYRLLFYLSLPLFSLMIIALPLISRVWIGYYEKIFVIFGVLLAISRFINMLNAPSYFVYLGIGELRWNVAGHIVTGVLNVCLGFILGFYLNGIGVVIAWAISLALGSSIIFLSYHIRNKIPLVELIPKASRQITITCLTGTLMAFLIQEKLNHVLSIVVFNSLIVLIFLIIIFIPFWLHPMRRRLMGWLMNDLLNKKAGAE